MYSINYIYKDKSSLINWLNDKNLNSQKECLVQIFCGTTNESIIKKISSILYEYLPYAHIIGSTTDGEIINNNVLTKKILISVTVFEKSTLSSHCADYVTTSYDLGKEIASNLDNTDVKALILFTTGLEINGEDFLLGIKDVSDNRYPINGGMAGDNAEFMKTFVIHNDKVISKGAVGVALKGTNLYVHSQYKFGWDSIGLPLTVTKSYKNRVYEINDMPVTQIYRKYLGNAAADNLPKICLEIPLITQKDGVDIARVCLHKYDDGSLLFAGNIPEGETVQFGIGSIYTMLQETIEICDNIRESITPESIFIYSCMANRHLLKQTSSFELGMFKDLCHVSGFFTNAEFYSIKEKTYLFNQTMTVLALSEKDTLPNKNTNKPNNNFSTQQIIDNTTLMSAISHMTNVIASEWKMKIDEEIDRSKQLLQKTKQAQMGEMVGMIAHQWRQPLNAISATCINMSLLSNMDKLDKDRLQQSSKFIQDQCQNMSSTINTFMDFIKPPCDSKPFKLLHSIESIMQIMGAQLSNHDIEVSIDADDKNISIVGHEDLLEQVIINLLSNSRDAFDDQNITTKFIKILIQKKDNTPIITIEDNAGGVKKEIKDNIFNPYFTTKEQGEGTGIGLYLSLSIMKKSFKGNLTHKNTKHGSLFEISFPNEVNDDTKQDT